MMHGREKSDLAIVAMKSPNKTGGPAAEAMERRTGAEENASRRIIWGSIIAVRDVCAHAFSSP